MKTIAILLILTDPGFSTATQGVMRFESMQDCQNAATAVVKATESWWHGVRKDETICVPVEVSE